MRNGDNSWAYIYVFLIMNGMSGSAQLRGWRCSGAASGLHPGCSVSRGP